MNEVQVFNFENNKVRTVVVNDDVYFVGKDVAEILGYSDTVNALKQHVDGEDKIVGCQNTTPCIIDSLGRKQYPTFINESGVYSLVFGSKLPTAKKFKHWVTSEVLPTIRKTGGYNLPKNFAEALRQLADQAEKNEQLQIENKEMKPKALFADAVASSKTSILVGDLAKILKQNGFDVGANRLFSILREKGYLIKRQGSDWNMPTQKSMEMGLFEVKEHTHLDSNGRNITTKTPKLTGKGQIYFVNKFCGD